MVEDQSDVESVGEVRRSDDAATGHQPIGMGRIAVFETEIQSALVDEQRPGLELDQERVAALVEAGEGHLDVRLGLGGPQRESVVPVVVIGQEGPGRLIAILLFEQVVEELVDVGAGGPDRLIGRVLGRHRPRQRHRRRRFRQIRPKRVAIITFIH